MHVSTLVTMTISHTMIEISECGIVDPDATIFPWNIQPVVHGETRKIFWNHFTHTMVESSTFGTSDHGVTISPRNF